MKIFDAKYAAHNNGFPPLKIGDLVIDIPIIQGGMGVKISRTNLATAVSECGGLGVIASVGLGDDFGLLDNYSKTSEEALREEIAITREKTKNPFAVNIMVALSNYENLCRICSEENVSAILSGAGLPLKLPEYVENKNVKLIPIVSSAKAADLIIRHWEKRYNRLPDAFVIEGPKAGGHLGFDRKAIDDKVSVLDIIAEVKEVIAQRTDTRIPLIAAGGIFSGKDILEALEAGADGVQMATRFIATIECDAPEELKQACVDAKEDDIVILRSPVGLLARILKNDFVKRIIEQDTIKFKCPYKCLRSCKQEKARFCIAQALVNASQGNLKEGFIMPGANVYRLDKIISVKELFDTIHEEAFGKVLKS